MSYLLRAVLFSLTIAASPSFSQPAIAQHWQELEGRWNEAHLRGDLEALGDLWANDLSIIVPKMSPMDKGSALRFWRTVPVKFTQYASSDLSANELGTTAVVTGKLLRSREFGGRVATDTWLFTKVYARRDGKWRVIAFHASEAPQ